MRRKGRQDMSEHGTDANLDALPEEIAETTANTLAAIGFRIRELRQLRRLTLQELADVSGLSTSMLSLVERGRASPSIGSLIVIASALGVAMSDLLVNGADSEEKIVVRASEARKVETAQHVVRRLLREDRSRGVSVAVNEYAPHTGSAEHPISHGGFEYGFVLCAAAGRSHRLQLPPQAQDLEPWQNQSAHALVQPRPRMRFHLRGPRRMACSRAGVIGNCVTAPGF